MPVPIAVGVAAGRAVAGKLRGKKGKKRATTRRRPKRIVFSENQWRFVQALMRMAGGRAPSFPGRKPTTRRKFF